MTKLEYLTMASSYTARKQKEKEEKQIVGYIILGIGCLIIGVVINLFI